MINIEYEQTTPTTKQIIEIKLKSSVNDDADAAADDKMNKLSVNKKQKKKKNMNQIALNKNTESTSYS